MALAEIAAVVGGQLRGVPDPQAPVTSVVLDSRLAGPGRLFAAFDGERVDGHEFAGRAVDAGGVAVLASREVDAPAVVVADVQQALGALAERTARDMTGVRKVGVTGSSGKTSTKDLLAQVLSHLGATAATLGSQNNELGVPLTVLGAPADTQYLVLEMGARGIGHLSYLTGMVPLDVALVLNVGSAHAGEFGDREATAQAKGELLEGLGPGGYAVLNADDPLVAPMASRTRAETVFFGWSPQAQIRAEDVRLDSGGRSMFLLRTPTGEAEVRLRVLGEHQVDNALAVAGAAHVLGMTAAAIAQALSEAVATTGSRMERHERADGVTVIDDAYNANPDSMAAASRALVALAQGRRSVAVIGEMRELGAQSPAEHRAVGALAGSLGVEAVVGVGGEEAAQVVAGAEDSGVKVVHLADGSAEAAALLEDLLQPGDVVLVKGSQAAGLQSLVKEILGDRAR